MFRQLPGPPAAQIGVMQDEIMRVYATLATRLVRKPSSPRWSRYLPKGIFVPDWPVYKHRKSLLSDVSINNGLHMHGIMMARRRIGRVTPRLRESVRGLPAQTDIGLWKSSKFPVIPHCAAGDETSFFLVDQADKRFSAQCQRCHEVWMHFAVHPVDKAVRIVDLGEILRQQEFHEAEGKFVLWASHDVEISSA